MTNTFRTYYLLDNPPESEFVRNLIQTCLDVGCTTTRDGRTDVCKYVSADTGVMRTTEETDVAIDSIAAGGTGTIDLWYEDLRLSLEINQESPYVPDVPSVSVMVWSRLESYSEDDDALIRARVEQFLEIARPLAELADPTYAYGFVEKYEPEDVCPTERDVREGTIENIFWLNVFSEPAIATLGEERLLSAPAWTVEKLSTDSIFLVVNDSPWYCAKAAEEIASFLGIR